MSYILDALRRADAERERGNVPGLHAQPTRPAPASSAAGVSGTPRRLWPWAFIAVLLLALGWMGWRLQDAVAVAPVGVKAASSNPALSTPPVQVATQSPPAQPAAAEPPIPVPSPSVAEVAPRTIRKQAVPNMGQPKKTAAATPRLPSPAETVASAAPDSSGTLYTAEQLPEDIRRDLPKLTIGGSAYSESASSRFIIVNGQLLHEGDSLAPGLVLQQIKLKTVILAFRGYRYRLAL